MTDPEKPADPPSSSEPTATPATSGLVAIGQTRVSADCSAIDSFNSFNQCDIVARDDMNNGWKLRFVNRTGDIEEVWCSEEKILQVLPNVLTPNPFLDAQQKGRFIMSLTQKKEPPPPLDPTAPPVRPAVVPESLWGIMSNDERRDIAGHAANAQQARENIVALDQARKGAAELQKQFFEADNAKAEFAAEMAMRGLPLPPGADEPIFDLNGFNEALDRKREDDKAVLAASMAAIDKAMWRVSHEYNERQRTVDKEETNRLRERDRTDADNQRQIDLKRFTEQRQEDIAIAERRHKEEIDSAQRRHQEEIGAAERRHSEKIASAENQRKEDVVSAKRRRAHDLRALKQRREDDIKRRDNQRKDDLDTAKRNEDAAEARRNRDATDIDRRYRQTTYIALAAVVVTLFGSAMQTWGQSWFKSPTPTASQTAPSAAPVALVLTMPLTVADASAPAAPAAPLATVAVTSNASAPLATSARVPMKKAPK